MQECANVLGCSFETKLRSDLKHAKPLLKEHYGMSSFGKIEVEYLLKWLYSMSSIITVLYKNKCVCVRMYHH